MTKPLITNVGGASSRGTSSREFIELIASSLLLALVPAGLLAIVLAVAV